MQRVEISVERILRKPLTASSNYRYRRSMAECLDCFHRNVGFCELAGRTVKTRLGIGTIAIKKKNYTCIGAEAEARSLLCAE